LLHSTGSWSKRQGAAGVGVLCERSGEANMFPELGVWLLVDISFWGNKRKHMRLFFSYL
jgi:hypothetical protein